MWKISCLVKLLREKTLIPSRQEAISPTVAWHICAFHYHDLLEQTQPVRTLRRFTCFFAQMTKH